LVNLSKKLNFLEVAAFVFSIAAIPEDVSLFALALASNAAFSFFSNSASLAFFASISIFYLKAFSLASAASYSYLLFIASIKLNLDFEFELDGSTLGLGGSYSLSEAPLTELNGSSRIDSSSSSSSSYKNDSDNSFFFFSSNFFIRFYLSSSLPLGD
jgi:hypothetical protein